MARVIGRLNAPVGAVTGAPPTGSVATRQASAQATLSPSTAIAPGASRPLTRVLAAPPARETWRMLPVPAWRQHPLGAPVWVQNAVDAEVASAMGVPRSLANAVTFPPAMGTVSSVPLAASIQ